jgi:enoyl-CoA hydratase
MDSILLITLNRPQVRNAVNRALAEALSAALDQLDTQPDLRVGVLTGAGKGFCSGMDLAAFLHGDDGETVPRGFAGITRHPSAKPLVAAIEGFALAGGFEIALACDLIVASRSARMGLPEVTRSLVATGGGLLRLGRRTSFHVAMEIALTGQSLDVQRLWQLGLVNRMTEPGESLQTALELARTIAANGAAAVAATKRILVGAQDWSLEEEAWEEQDRIAAQVWKSDEASNGATAFLDRGNLNG